MKVLLWKLHATRLGQLKVLYNDKCESFQISHQWIWRYLFLDV